MNRQELIKKYGKKSKVELWKKFKKWDDKLYYTGTLRGALKRIPEGHEDQYDIVFLENDND